MPVRLWQLLSLRPDRPFILATGGQNQEKIIITGAFSMERYILKRIAQSLIVLFGITAVVFFVLNLTGNVLDFMLPPGTAEEVYEEYTERLGLDDPLLVQYGRFLVKAVQGDFGESHFYKQPALEVVLERIPATFTLAVAAFLIALAWSIPIGILSAYKRNSLLDTIARVIAMLGQSIPNFWFGILLMLIFSVKLNLLPTYGYESYAHLILPAFALSTGTGATILRLLRSSMIDVLGQEYISVARAKGVHNFALVAKHAFKNCLSSVLTIMGLQLASVMSGALVIESVFSWPGVGRLLQQSILNRDFMVVEAGVCVIACLFVFINLLVDVLYAVINPRIKYS